MRIIKTIIVFIIIGLSSGCFLLEQDELMVCDYAGINGKMSYEVSYMKDEVHKITIVYEKDLSKIDSKLRKQKTKEYEKEVEGYNKVKGLDVEFLIDHDLGIIVIEVNTDVYDVEKDKQNIFLVDFNDHDFKTPKLIRDKLDENGFVCDPIVSE